MAVIDVKLLPERPLLDTSVLIRGVGERPEDPRAPLCRDLLETLIKAGRDILFAAPSLAEVLRFRPGTRPPSVAGMVVVPFDDQAAILLGTTFPQDLLKQVARDTGDSLSYFKFDAMILACAKRHRADCVIALDDGMHVLAQKVGIRIELPDAFQARQLELIDGAAEVHPMAAKPRS